MTHLSTTPNTASPSRTLRYVDAGLRVVLALVLFGACVPKLTADSAMVTMFDKLGDDPMRLLVGCAELAGAVGLFVPRLRTAAALGLVALLLGATLASLVVLHENPLLPLVLAVVAVFLARNGRSASAR